MEKPKICFASSSGGHFEQLMALKPLMKKYDSILVTEKTLYDYDVDDTKIYYLKQTNRKETLGMWHLFTNSFRSLRIMIKEKPDIIVTTGVLAVIPLCLLAKIARKKLIYIESFAKVHSGNLTGKFLHKYSDAFIVQWETMLDIYPDAIYAGSIY